MLGVPRLLEGDVTASLILWKSKNYFSRTPKYTPLFTAVLGSNIYISSVLISGLLPLSNTEEKKSWSFTLNPYVFKVSYSRTGIISSLTYLQCVHIARPI
jgi:hypothetical protein